MRVKEIMDETHPFIYENELATKAPAMIRDFNKGRLTNTVDRKDVAKLLC